MDLPCNIAYEPVLHPVVPHPERATHELANDVFGSTCSRNHRLASVCAERTERPPYLLFIKDNGVFGYKVFMLTGSQHIRPERQILLPSRNILGPLKV